MQSNYLIDSPLIELFRHYLSTASSATILGIIFSHDYCHVLLILWSFVGVYNFVAYLFAKELTSLANCICIVQLHHSILFLRNDNRLRNDLPCNRFHHLVKLTQSKNPKLLNIGDRWSISCDILRLSLSIFQLQRQLRYICKWKLFEKSLTIDSL